MQNFTSTTRWADFVASEPPIMAKDSNGNYVGSEYIGTFLDNNGLVFLLRALNAAAIAFGFVLNESFSVDAGESRKPYDFTIVEGESLYTFEAKQILGLLLAGVPGKLAFSAGDFRFVPDPVAPPAPRPDPGPTSGDDLRNTGGVVGDSGAFTAADRALLCRIAGKLGAL